MKPCIEPGGCFQYAYGTARYCYHHNKHRQGLYDAVYDHLSLTPDQVATDEMDEVVLALRSLGLRENEIRLALRRGM